VADYHVPLSLGVQTGGSVIRPAAYTGVFAFKPTYNAISPEGTTVFSPTFDTLGIFARSIEDLQLLADVFAIKDIVEPTDVNMSKASIALIKTPNWEMAGPGTGKAMKRTTDILKEHGVKVEEDSLPARLGNGTDMRRTLLAVSNGEAQTSFMAEYRKHKAKLDPQIQTIVENKINITRAERLEATDKLAGLRPTVDELFAKYSAIVTPSAVDEAPIGLHDMGLPYFNTIWTVRNRSPWGYATLTNVYRLFMCLSSIFLLLLEAMACLLECLLLQADVAINSF
jgi:Asp-tRNA(Asn)/Glu-tRNA(Gln) amidotransferase A subunit family amidase